MFGRKRSGEMLDTDLLGDLKRGQAGGLPPVAAAEHFPSAETIATNPDLAFDPVNRDGKVFLGLVNATMQRDTGSPVAQGGHLVGRTTGCAPLLAGQGGNRMGQTVIPLFPDGESGVDRKDCCMSYLAFQSMTNFSKKFSNV